MKITRAFLSNLNLDRQVTDWYDKNSGMFGMEHEAFLSQIPRADAFLCICISLGLPQNLLNRFVITAVESVPQESLGRHCIEVAKEYLRDPSPSNFELAKKCYTILDIPAKDERDAMLAMLNYSEEWTLTGSAVSNSKNAVDKFIDGYKSWVAEIGSSNILTATQLDIVKALSRSLDQVRSKGALARAFGWVAYSNDLQNLPHDEVALINSIKSFKDSSVLEAGSCKTSTKLPLGELLKNAISLSLGTILEAEYAASNAVGAAKYVARAACSQAINEIYGRYSCYLKEPSVEAVNCVISAVAGANPYNSRIPYNGTAEEELREKAKYIQRSEIKNRQLISHFISFPEYKHWVKNLPQQSLLQRISGRIPLK
ncbi:MAG TPA: hypothetical protein PLV42_10950 [bacterium]|nr:hypothetical protein [bacterium]